MALAVVVACGAQAAALEHKTGIWKVLRDGNFGRMMNEDAHVWPVGDITAGARHYHFEHYEWSESKKNMTGSWPHGTTLLLVFERTPKGLVYLGSYENFEGQRPRIKGNSLIFPFKDIEIMGVKKAKVITFDENGPPARVHLGEDYVDFIKKTSVTRR